MAGTTTLIKATRKFIDDNNYKEALKLCREILRKDPENYIAFVFIGKSLEMSDKAPKAFEKAISIQPRNPLAWKGLANYYEKKEDSQSKVKLIAIYDHLLRMKIDKYKIVDIIIKVSQLGRLLKNEKAINVILKCLDMKPGPEVYNAAVKELPNLLLSNIVYEKKYITTALNHIMSHVWKQPERTLCATLSQSTLNKNINLGALDVTTRTSCFEAHIIFRKRVCQYLCSQFIKNENFCGIDIEKNKIALTRGFERHKYSILLKSMISFSKRRYFQAYLEFAPLVLANKINYIEGIYMIKCNIKLGRWIVVERIASEFGVGSKDREYLMELKRFKFLALAEQKKWDQACRVGKSLPAEYVGVGEQATLAKCLIENNEDADHFIEKLRSTEYYLQLKALFCMVRKDYKRAIYLLEGSDPHPVNLLYVAKSYWALKEFEKCYIYLTKAIQLDPKSAEINLYMGMWHDYYKPDYNIAKKFYERAYELNSSDDTIVRHLSYIYWQLNIKYNHMIILQTHSVFAPNQKWVHYRLAQIHMANQDWGNACNEFLLHIQVYSNDAAAFICLAEANYRRESYRVAIDNYKRAMTLDPKQKIFCLTRIGYIYNAMDDHNTALRTFKEVFEMNPDYILAFKGAAHAWTKSAAVIAQIRHYHIARDGLQVAVNYLIRGLTLTKNLTIFWKLLGKTLMALTNLPHGYDFVELNFDSNDALTDLGTVYLKNSIVKIAEYCYWRAYCEMPDWLNRLRGRELSMEIIEEERVGSYYRLARPRSERRSYGVYERRNNKTPNNN